MKSIDESFSPTTEALIFDLDGTLVDSMPIHLEAWLKTSEEFGFPFSKERLHELAGIPATEITHRLNTEYDLDLNPQAVATRKQELFLELLPGVKVIPMVFNLVVSQYGERSMAIGSGGRRNVVVKTLDLLDLLKFFPVIVTADDVNRYKPDPETFLKCAHGLKVRPEKCHVFEDGDPGLEAAKSCGMGITDVRNYFF